MKYTTNPPRSMAETLRIQSLLKQADDAMRLLQLDEIPMSRLAEARMHLVRAALCELEVAILFNEPISQNEK